MTATGRMTIRQEELLDRSNSLERWPTDMVEASRDELGDNRGVNVGQSERIVSGAAGTLLILQGLKRADLLGLAIAGVGGALAYRGAVGHCAVYEKLGFSTAEKRGCDSGYASGIDVAVSYLIDKPPEELYAFWRDFSNLPRIMKHLQSVEVRDERRSHWIAKAPSIYGGRVEWDAEITADEPNSRIAWRSLPDGDVEHHGMIEFQPAAGDRGTAVRVSMEYQPPGGKVGRWIAKLFGEEPEQQIREDLRNFKRMMEMGELPTIEGQPRGKCTGRG